MSPVPPEGTKKYPWALGEMKVGVPVVFRGKKTGERAVKAARMWCYRNHPDGKYRMVARYSKATAVTTIWLMEKKA